MNYFRMRQKIATNYLASSDFRKAKHLQFHSTSTVQGFRNCYKVLKFAASANDRIIVSKYCMGTRILKKTSLVS